MLEGLLHHKKEEKEYLSALMISEDRVDAALWESGAKGEVHVLKTSQKTFSGEWDDAIRAADEAVTEIEIGLPEGKELTKVVFGLFPEWIVEDRIKDTRLKQLKQLTSALSLTPLGFVEMPSAINHLLQKDEGVAQTVILAGVESKHLTVSLLKIGKMAGSLTLPRTASVTADLEKALASFTDVEVLPSRILLYGTDPGSANVKTELLNYPWQKKANFLHVPKIEVLPSEYAVKAVAFASSSEFTMTTTAEEEPADIPEKEVVGQATAISHKSEEVAEIASDLNSNEVEVEAPDRHVEPAIALTMDEEEDSNVESVVVPSPQFSKPVKNKFALPHFSFPKLSFSIRVPSLPKLKLLGAVAVLLLVLIGGFVSVYWLLPKATITLLVSPQTLDRKEDITLDPSVTAANAEQKILPAKQISHEIEGTKEIKTTGKKTIGDRAKGEITIYNKTLNTKSLSKGAVLATGKLKFTLDEDIQVASASEGVGSLTYGSTKAKATASSIGTESNVGAGTEFSLADLPGTSYSARNDQAFSGGTSKEVSVVSREDVTNAREEAVKEFTAKGEGELSQKLAAGEKLLDNSSTAKILKEVFSKEVGEEADVLIVKVTLALSAFAYNEDDFYALLDSVVAASVPENYSYKKEDAKIKVENVSGEKDEARVFSTRITLSLIPNVEVKDLAKALAGKSVEDATEYLKMSSGVSGVEFDIRSPLQNQKQQLPRNAGNITINVSSV